MTRAVPVLALLLLLLATSVSPPVAADGGACTPRITDTTPAGRVMDAYPVVRVTVDATCHVDDLDASFTLDGRSVTPTADGAHALAFTPRDALAPGPHVVHARVEDAHGNVTRATWEFLVRGLDVPGERVIAHVPGRAGARALPLDVHDPELLVDGAWARPVADAHALTVTLQRLRALPPDVTAPPADPLLLVDVASRARLGPLRDEGVTFGAGFTALTLRVAVPLDVLAADNSTPAQVHALAFVDGAWTRLAPEDARVNVTHAQMNVTLQGPAPVAIVVDSRAPVVRALAPAHAAPVGAPPVLRASVTDNVALALAEVVVDGRVTLAKRSDAGGVLEQDTHLLGLEDGWHTVTVRAVDASGNEGERSWRFILDRESPTFPRVHAGRLTGGGAGFTVDYVDALTGVRPASVRLTLDGRDVTPLADVTPTAAVFTPTKPLAAGEHVMVVSVTDRAGNVAEVRHAFTLPVAATPFPAGVLALAAVAVAVALTRRRP